MIYMMDCATRNNWSSQNPTDLCFVEACVAKLKTIDATLAANGSAIAMMNAAAHISRTQITMHTSALHSIGLRLREKPWQQSWLVQ
jgi:hypothetical protein